MSKFSFREQKAKTLRLLAHCSVVMVCIVFALFALQPSKGMSLTCHEVRFLTKSFIEHHFSYKDFDDEVGKRTFRNLMEAWDPSKLFFLKSDVETLRKKFETEIDDQIAKADCSVVSTVADLYSKRFFERHAEIPKLIAIKHKFDVEEHMTIDSDEIAWATSNDELKERWRKRIKFQHLQLKSALDDAEVRKKIEKRYALSKKRHQKMDSEDIYGIFLNAFSNALDPHSKYYSPSELEEFRIGTSLSLEGIGAMLRSEDGFTKILSLVKGGAAYKTGKVKVGDKIVAVAQGDEAPVDVIDMDLSEVVKKIRGKRGTTVKLSIVREEKKGTQNLVVAIVREKIKLEDREARSFVYQMQDKKNKKIARVGVLSLPTFYMDFKGRELGKKDYKSSSRDLLIQLNKLKKAKVDSVIVDLRSNGGGSLDEAINVAGLFLGSGPVVQIKADGDRANILSDKDDGVISYDGPLVVLINKQSASASEIFAGAIKDHGRGLILGDPSTFGKGTVQNLNDVSSKLGAIKVTVSKFYTPSGSSTQMKGVESDIIIPSLSAEYDIGEKHYDYALPWEKIKPAKLTNYGLVGNYLEKLKSKSKKRLSGDADFKEVATSIAEYKKSSKERVKVSLKADKTEGKTESNGQDDDPVMIDPTEKPKLDKDIVLREAINISLDYAHFLSKTMPLEYVENTMPKGMTKIKKNTQVKP